MAEGKLTEGFKMAGVLKVQNGVKKKSSATCDICNKTMRKDNLKRHKVSCVKKRKNPFIDDEADESDKENENEENIAPETESDLEFIDDAELNYDSDWDEDQRSRYRREINDRLKDLHAVSVLQEIEMAKDKKECPHCHDWLKNEDFENHEKKCMERKVKCYKCQKEYTIRVIKKHFRECKEPLPKKKKETKKKKKVSEGASIRESKKKKKTKKKARGRSIGGKQFKMQIHGAKKYKIVKKLQIFDAEMGKYYFDDKIKQFIIGNEFGSGKRAKPHCHAVMVMKKRTKFEDFKVWFKNKTGFTIHDLRSCKNLGTEVKYVCKEDYRAVNYNFDYDMLSVLMRAYIAAQKYNRLFASMYPYCNLACWQKKDFENFFKQFLEERKHDESISTFENIELRPWQARLLRVIDSNFLNNRQIVWIVDQEGNKGKSFFGFWLCDHKRAFRVNGDVQRKDFAYAYAEQPIVIFDLNRGSEDRVPYFLMEDIKNGEIWCPKYESHVKTFRNISVVVLVFANFEPDYTKLSRDRWWMYHLNRQSQLKHFAAPFPPVTHVITNQ